MEEIFCRGKTIIFTWDGDDELSILMGYVDINYRKY